MANFRFFADLPDGMNFNETELCVISNALRSRLNISKPALLNFRPTTETL